MIEHSPAWVVSSGSYSDYRVLCVCDTEERANLVAASLRGDSEGWRSDAVVEKLPLVDSDPEKIAILRLTTVISDSGSTTDTTERVEHEWSFDTTYPLVRVAWRWVRAPIYNNTGGRLEVYGCDFEAVRRVFSDRRAQLIAVDAFRLEREAKGRA